jgi:hypothetical protein
MGSHRSVCPSGLGYHTLSYGIDFRAVAGCIVSQSLVSHVGAYDEVSTAAAIRKFGHDVFKESAVEARTSLGAHSSNHEEDKGRSKTTISVTFSGGLRLFALLQPADLLSET